MDCIVVPGQIIDCQTAASATYQCVWASAAVAGGAQFWCDPSAEALLYGRVDANEYKSHSDKTFPPISPDQPDVPGAGDNVFSDDL